MHPSESEYCPRLKTRCAFLAVCFHPCPIWRFASTCLHARSAPLTLAPRTRRYSFLNNPRVKPYDRNDTVRLVVRGAMAEKVDHTGHAPEPSQRVLELSPGDDYRKAATELNSNGWENAYVVKVSGRHSSTFVGHITPPPRGCRLWPTLRLCAILRWAQGHWSCYASQWGRHKPTRSSTISCTACWA